MDHELDEAFLDTSLQMDLLAKRRAMLDLPETVMAEAEERCKEARLDVLGLRREWINNVLRNEEFEKAMENVPKSFLDWVDRKVADPYFLPAQASSLASLRLEDEAMRFSTIVWPQEIAWAKRLRRSDDIPTALLSSLFLGQARKNVVEQFKSLFPIYLVAQEDFAYIRLSVHDLTPDQIRMGMGSPSFEPLFLRHARSAFEPQLAKLLDMTGIDVIVAKIRREEEADIQDLILGRAVKALERSRITRMVSVIRAAIDIGLDSEMLDRAYEEFLQQVRGGKLRFDPQTGLPDAEFRSWLRVQSLKRPSRGKAPIRNADNPTLYEIVKRPKRWVEGLPEEYRSLGGNVSHVLHAWLQPIVADERPAPRDFVLDYGFHLVDTVLVKRTHNAS